MRMSSVGSRIAILATSAVVALGLGGCAGIDAQTDGAPNSCGNPYELIFGGHEFFAGSCSGSIYHLRTVVHVKRGTRFKVQIIWSRGGILEYPLPLSTGIPVQLISLRNGVATYIAYQTGRADLVAYHTTSCGAYSSGVHTCDAYTIDVTR